VPPENPAGPEDATPQPETTQHFPDEIDQRSFRAERTIRRSGESVPEYRGLSGKERAGVWLTWGVLLMITLFLGVALIYLWTSQHPACKALDALGEPLSKALTEGKPLPETITAVFQQCETQRQAFYEFWLDLVQRVLLNALLPVLTALLGYLFGTQQSATSQE